MFKKSFLAVMFVAVGIFAAFGTAQAGLGSPAPGAVPAYIDGLVSGTNVTPDTLNVYLNPGGTGDGLVYGYYNARGSYNFFKVVNTSSTHGVGAKVRFREGKNSNELLDFYICLSAMDQWSAWIIGENNGSPAFVMWYDSDTPTFPDPTGTGLGDNDASNNMGAYKYLRYGDTGAASSVTIDDTNEGYFEIIANVAWEDVAGSNKVISTPYECGETVLTSGEWASLGISEDFDAPTLYDAPNTLFGNSYIFDLKEGITTFAYNATALANLIHVDAIPGSLGVDSIPRLSDADDGLEAVNFVLTKAREFATYDLGSIVTDTDGSTTIINTFPTKMLSIKADQATGNFFLLNSPNGPFNDDAEYNDPQDGGAGDGSKDGKIIDDAARCEEVTVVVYDDTENTLSNPTCDFSPCTPQTVTYEKCDEVSLFVVGLGETAPLTSTLVQANIDTSSFERGWLYEDFTVTSGVFAGRMSWVIGTDVVAVSVGMPVISFELQRFANGYLTHMLPLRYEADAAWAPISN